MDEIKYNGCKKINMVDDKIIDYPILLLIMDDEKSTEIISKIRNTSNENNVVETHGNLKLYLHEVKTKYFATKIALYASKNIITIPKIIKEKSEGIIMYFNSQDRSFLDKLPEYVNFIKNYRIEFSIVLCNQLQNDTSDGITFKCLKDFCNTLDIIELDKSIEENNEDVNNPVGYEELDQALKSVIWSNVNMNRKATKSNTCLNDVDINVEDELENFEKLLGQVMQFRPTTNDLSRDDRLDCAQIFAEIFEKLILQDQDNGEDKSSSGQ